VALDPVDGVPRVRGGMDAETVKEFRAAAAADLSRQPGAPEIRLRMDALLTRAHKA
jgi:hypothetical protein